MPRSSAIHSKRISNLNLPFIPLRPLPLIQSWIPNPLPRSIPLSTSLWLDLFSRPQSRWAPVSPASQVCVYACVCVCVSVCGISHQVQKAKKVEKWKEWERPEQTKLGRSWTGASLYQCKKERYLPEICEEDLSDGTEGHRHVLLCDGTLRWECSRSECTSL